MKITGHAGPSVVRLNPGSAWALSFRRWTRTAVWVWQRGIGWPGTVGLVALLAAAFVQFSLYTPMERSRAEVLRNRVAELSAQSRRMDPPGGSGGSDRAEPQRDPRDAWLASAPPVKQRTGQVARLLSAAQSSGLEIGAADYTVEAQAPGLSRLRITLPVAGSYVQMRRYVGRVLGQLPYAGLDGLQIERPGGDQPGLQATVRWSLYFREIAP